MKPLTIEELKALQVGDWVWVAHLNKKHDDEYAYINYSCGEKSLFFYRGLRVAGLEDYASTYGVDWIAYKNKEQAETKEQCVICHKDISNELPKIDVYGNRYCEECYFDKCKKEQFEIKYKALHKAVIEICGKLNNKSFTMEFYRITQGSKIQQIERLAEEAEARFKELRGEK